MTRPVNIMHMFFPQTASKPTIKGFPLNIFQVAGYMQ